MNIACPTCGSNDIQNAAMAVTTGTSTAEGTTLGGGIGVTHNGKLASGWHHGTTRTTSQTALAERYSYNPSGSVRSMGCLHWVLGIGGIIAGIGFLFTPFSAKEEPPWDYLAAAVGLFFIALCIWAGKRKKINAEAAVHWEHMRRLWVCLRCGCEFVPDQGGGQAEGAPSAAEPERPAAPPLVSAAPAPALGAPSQPNPSDPSDPPPFSGSMGTGGGFQAPALDPAANAVPQADPWAADEKPNDALVWAAALLPLLLFFVSVLSGAVACFLMVFVGMGLMGLDRYFLLKKDGYVDRRQLLAKHGYSDRSLRISALLYPIYMFRRARLLGQTQIHLIVWGFIFAVGIIINVAAGAGSGPMPAYAEDDGGMVVLEVSDELVNVRDKPTTTESQILAQLKSGDVLVAEKRTIPGGDMSWYKIVSLVDKDAWHITDALQTVHKINAYPYISANFVRPYSGGCPVRNILDQAKIVPAMPSNTAAEAPPAYAAEEAEAEASEEDAAPEETEAVVAYTPKIIYDIGRYPGRYPDPRPPAPRPASKIYEIATLTSTSGYLLDPNVKHIRESGLLAKYDEVYLSAEYLLLKLSLGTSYEAVTDPSSPTYQRLYHKFNAFNCLVVLSELEPSEYGTPTHKNAINGLLQDILLSASRGDPW